MRTNGSDASGLPSPISEATLCRSNRHNILTCGPRYGLSVGPCAGSNPGGEPNQKGCIRKGFETGRRVLACLSAQIHCSASLASRSLARSLAGHPPSPDVATKAPRIRGLCCLDRDRQAEAVRVLGDATDAIILICAHGFSSSLAARRLQDLGFVNARCAQVPAAGRQPGNDHGCDPRDLHSQ